MKISLIGPGIMPIPPLGWGAVEILVWDTKTTLETLGHEVQIINTQNYDEIIEKINSFSPDFVHIHYDEFIPIYPYINYPKAITSHYGYLDRPDMFGGYVNIANQFANIKPNVFCLSESIKKIYKVLFNIPEENLFLTPNGVKREQFRKINSPEHKDRSIYLAKIEPRKRQYLFQNIDSLWYAGNIVDGRFDKTKNYLGEWDKNMLHSNLTDYGNLVLLSDGEAHPLVCMEALAAGLGLVIVEWAKANLDLSKNFVSVIPETKINDIDYIEKQIIENRQYSINNRDEIFEYSKLFDWTEIIKNYYLPSINLVIENYEKNSN